MIAPHYYLTPSLPSLSQQTILDSVKKEDSSFTGDGFTSLAIVYAVFSLSNWFVPSAIALIGPNVSMVIGGVFYA